MSFKSFSWVRCLITQNRFTRPESSIIRIGLIVKIISELAFIFFLIIILASWFLNVLLVLLVIQDLNEMIETKAL